MRRYACPQHRDTCRCGAKRPASFTLVWPVIIAVVCVLIGIGAGIRALYRDGHLANVAGSIGVVAVLIILITALVKVVNSPLEVVDAQRAEVDVFRRRSLRRALLP